MSSVINYYAPTCAVPHCTNKVRYKKKYVKADNTLGARWHNCCDKHRTTAKAERNEYILASGGCVRCGCKDVECLTIDHIDGNRHNNNYSNKQVLCANCHQKKTKENGDHLNTYKYVNTQFDKLFEYD